MSDFAIGVDIGGTNTKFGVVDILKDTISRLCKSNIGDR